MKKIRNDITDRQTKPFGRMAWPSLTALGLIVLVLAAVFLGRIERLQERIVELNARLERLENADVGSTGHPTSLPALSAEPATRRRPPSPEPAGEAMTTVLLARQTLDRNGQGSPAAVQLLTPLVDREPNAYEPRYWLGRALLRMGQADAALTHFVELAKSHPDRAEPLHWQGVVLLRLDQTAQAVGLFRSAIELDETFAPAWQYLGLAEANADRLPEAVEMLETAIRLSPETAEAHFALAVCRLRLDESEAAVTAFTRAVELDASLAERAKQAQLFDDVDDPRLDAIWK